MKGVSLAINTTVLIVLAIIILLVLVALIFTGVLPPMGIVTKDTVLRTCCQTNIPFICTESFDTTTVKCFIPETMKSDFSSSLIDANGFMSIGDLAASVIGSSSAASIQQFCNC